jgi:beta-phosphoglucomutase-like phosphatase (HAD superfamily)
MPGLFSAIRVFNQMDFAKAIASSSRREWIIWGLEELKLKDEFPVIVSGEEVREAKPAPEIFLLASKRLGLERERCLVLEDTIIGVQSAKGAGMKVIAIPNQYNQDEDFSRADLRLNSLTEIDEALIRTLLLKR